MELSKKKEKLVRFLTACAELWKEELTSAKISLYWAVLRNYSEEELERAMVEVLRTSKFFPKPADIVEAIEKQREGNSVEALMILERAIERYGAYHSIAFTDKKINTAVKVLGGWVRVCGYDDRFLGRDFQEAYRQAPPTEDYLPGIVELSGSSRIPFVIVGRARERELTIPVKKLPELLDRLRKIPYHRIYAVENRGLKDSREGALRLKGNGKGERTNDVGSRGEDGNGLP